jgi:gamma-glutamylputrescine oxidase
MVDAPQRPPLTIDADVDVCVIGGGLAGLTTAREIARRGWTVVVLEASRLASGASGRNTGFVLPGFAADPDSLIARVGFDRTRDLWALSQAGVDYVRDIIQAEAAPGIDASDGWLYVSKTDRGDEFVRLVGELGELGCEIEGWPTERVRSVLRSDRYFNAIHYLRAFSVHPLNYALALAAAAERDGARIFEDTPALSIDPAGVRKRIVTPNARLRASHVVLCGNVQIGALMPRLASTLTPITTYVMTTAPLGPALGEAIGYRGAVSDTDLADSHYRIVGGDRLMWLGRSTAWPRNPRTYVGALTANIKKTYPQLGEVAAEFAWSGTLGNTVHRMPQIGEFAPGVWLGSGFGGHGLNTTAMAGNLIARAIIDGDDTWKQFNPFELVWAGGIGGRVAAQLRVWLKRVRDAIDERRAQFRYGAQRDTREVEQAAFPEQATAAEPDGSLVPEPEPAPRAEEFSAPETFAPPETVESDQVGRESVEPASGVGDSAPPQPTPDAEPQPFPRGRKRPRSRPPRERAKAE